MRLLSFIILIAWNSLAFSQGFKVKEFKQNMSDGSAFHAPMDANGHPCGLVKVRSDNAELRFGGCINGDVENRTNEYWVYMTQGCHQLQIKHPNFLPLNVNFQDFGIEEVVSKATYVLTLSELKYKPEKTGLTITLSPESASFFIDDVLVDNLMGNGLYQLYLPKGDHICRFEQKGYRPIVEAITTGKGIQNLNIELESVMAELEVKCKTSTAEIFIDGKKKGNGSWKGTVLAGDHQIEARQQNYEPCLQTISLAEKESRSFVIPELKRSMGKVRIVTNPSGMPVIVDGKDVGISPCTIEVESGKHYVSCKSYGVHPTRSYFEVNGGKTNEVKLQIHYEGDWIKEYYERAYNGSKEDILFLSSQACRTGNYQEAIFWIDRHPQGETIVRYWHKYGEELDINAYWQCDWIYVYSEIGNPEKALEIYPLWKEYEENHGGIFHNTLEMMYIGNGFFKKKDINKAIQCYEKAEEDGYEGLGDCYATKGNKQLAASYYRKCLNIEYGDNRNRIENKLKELGY